MKIILLEQPEPNHVRYVLWCDVPVAKQPYYANAAAESAYKLRTQGEVDALRAGSVVEFTEAMHFLPGTNLATKRQRLEARLATVQAEVNASGSTSTLGLYGATFNGTSWSGGGL